VTPLAQSAVVDDGHVVVTYDNGVTVRVPFEWFTPSPLVSPDFTDVSVIDDGQTLKLGEYEADALFAYEEHHV
jgi:outer membrane lipoprotein-sorting protein